MAIPEAAHARFGLGLASVLIAATVASPRSLCGVPQHSGPAVQSQRSVVPGGRTESRLSVHTQSRWHTGTLRGFPRPGAGLPGGLGEGEAFLHSLVVPGLAQYRQQQHRWIAYAGVEVLSAVLYLAARADALGLRDDYRTFAWSAARAGFSTEPRQDGDFEYYERLTRWGTSGQWDSDPVLEGLQPESNPATYNGSVWALAMDIFNLDAAAPRGSPAYGRALDYYRANGYGPPFLWAWREGSGDQRHFAGLIASSDGRFRDARLALGVLVANHVFSALDGFITARLRALPDIDGVALTLSLPVR